jgi:hypothetical protein
MEKQEAETPIPTAIEETKTESIPNEWGIEIVDGTEEENEQDQTLPEGCQRMWSEKAVGLIYFSLLQSTIKTNFYSSGK